jgi:hypothetical protein
MTHLTFVLNDFFPLFGDSEIFVHLAAAPGRRLVSARSSKGTKLHTKYMYVCMYASYIPEDSNLHTHRNGNLGYLSVALLHQNRKRRISTEKKFAFTPNIMN